MPSSCAWTRLNWPKHSRATRRPTRTLPQLSKTRRRHGQLLELSTLYGNKQITALEWIEARDRIKARIDKADRRLRSDSDQSGTCQSLRTR